MKEPSWGSCLIPILAFGVFISLGTCTVLTGVLQKRALARFVDSEATRFPPLSVSEAQRQITRGKLTELRSAASTGEAAEVRFTTEDLNTLVATSELTESMRDNTRVNAIRTSGIDTSMSQELRGNRFLNGTFVFTPDRSGTNTWQLMLQDIRIPGKTVPDGFLNMYRDLHMFRFDAGNEELQMVLKRVEAMELEDGAIVIIIPPREDD